MGSLPRDQARKPNKWKKNNLEQKNKHITKVSKYSVAADVLMQALPARKKTGWCSLILQMFGSKLWSMQQQYRFKKIITDIKFSKLQAIINYEMPLLTPSIVLCVNWPTVVKTSTDWQQLDDDNLTWTMTTSPVVKISTDWQQLDDDNLTWDQLIDGQTAAAAAFTYYITYVIQLPLTHTML